MARKLRNGKLVGCSEFKSLEQLEKEFYTPKKPVDRKAIEKRVNIEIIKQIGNQYDA